MGFVAFLIAGLHPSLKTTSAKRDYVLRGRPFIQEQALQRLIFRGNASAALRSERGFTLVELLVVLVVIGITLGLTAVQLMPDNRAVLREESTRLALLLENAGLEAQASGRTLGWSGEGSHYHFWKKNEYNDWERIEDDQLFRPRELPEDIHISQITLDNKPILPGDKLSMAAYGFSQPFCIKLGNQYGNASITGKSTGDVIAALDK